MAAADLGEELRCSICLSIYTNPVTLRCGHNFCHGCIGTVLDNQEESGVYTCPECRKKFVRHLPKKNMKLCNMVQCFLSDRLKQEESGIFCIYCVDFPVPAVKMCLHCETSLCDIHRSAHKSEDHLLIEPGTSLWNRKCSIHKEFLKYYCYEDDACVCVSCCLAGEHRGHQVELLNETSQKKEKLRNILKKLNSKRENTGKKVPYLQNHMRKVQLKAASLTEQVTALFRNFQEHLKALEEQVLSEISRQEKEVSLKVSDLIQQLEKKEDELSRKVCHIKELCDMTDPFTVLQESESDRAEFYEEVAEAKIKCDLDECLISLTLHAGIHDTVSSIMSRFPVQEATDTLLDTNTAAADVAVSGDLKTASWLGNNDEDMPETPNRFIETSQVLSTRSFSSGRHYWIVEASESEDWDVGVAYPSMGRKGEDCDIGRNNKSWTLNFSEEGHSAFHDLIKEVLDSESSPQRFGIYLDYEAGQLSFYQLCKPIKHLHTFITTFTEPLHVAIWLGLGSWVKIIS
ncbi:E3 ubiquitin-protein ligase TRIM39-like [Rhinophrynus dorsalis]